MWHMLHPSDAIWSGSAERCTAIMGR
jgi:hypothetical protein